MTPAEWTHLPKIIFNAPEAASIASKSSSSKSCTLPSIASTKHSRLSTPSFSSGDEKGKRALSFSPMETPANVPLAPPLTPLIESHDVQCQWSGCSLLFASPVQLTEHIRSVHIDRLNCRTWFCQWESCSRPQCPFKSLYSLFLHLRTHTQDRPFQCTYPNCSKTFTRSEYLRLHQRSHTGEKPYPCEYPDCSKAFSNPSDRTKHIKRTHLNKKEYICQIAGCGKSYTDPSSLRKHVKTVHGEEAFRQKKHKKEDPSDEPRSNLRTIPTSINSIPLFNSSHAQSSNVFIEPIHPQDDDDEDVVVDQGIDMLRNNLEELSVGTVVHSRPRLRPMKPGCDLPSIQITGVSEETKDQSNTQVHFRTFPHHRISAQSGSTAYSSMRSESMNMEYHSNHSSFISANPLHPSVSPYEYDYSPIIDLAPRFATDRHLPVPGSSSSASHLTELSPSSSFCVSHLSGESHRPSPRSHPKIDHILYFLRTLDSPT